MNIRNMRDSDLEELVGLYRQFWGETSNLRKMQAGFKALNANLKYILLCAEVDGKIAGTIMGVICDELYGECAPFLIIEDFVVGEDFKRMGIGKALMEAVCKKAKKAGCSQVQFITERSRIDAVSFYESLGFDSTTHVGFKKVL